MCMEGKGRRVAVLDRSQQGRDTRERDTRERETRGRETRGRKTEQRQGTERQNRDRAPHAKARPWYRRAERRARHSPAVALLHSCCCLSVAGQASLAHCLACLALLGLALLGLALLCAPLLCLPLPTLLTHLRRRACRGQTLSLHVGGAQRAVRGAEGQGGRARRPRASRTPGSRALGVKKVVQPPSKSSLR